MNNLLRIMNHVNDTAPDFFKLPRIALGVLNQYNFITPLRHSINLSLTTTYPLAEGLVYGLYVPSSFQLFYQYGSFVGGVLMGLTCLLLYRSSLLGASKKKITKFQSLIFFPCFLLVNLYMVNAYSYHLGSTSWYLFASGLQIFALHLKSPRNRDFCFAAACFCSYPAIAVSLFQVFLEIFSRSFRYWSTFRIQYLRRTCLDVLFSYRITILVVFLQIIFFFPFGSGLRAPFDWRGFFTPFAFFPQGSYIHLSTYVVSAVVYVLALLSLFELPKRLEHNLRTDNRNLYHPDPVLHVWAYLFLFALLISSGSLTLSTTRHALFLMPLVVFLAISGFTQVLTFMPFEQFRSFRQLSCCAWGFSLVPLLFSSHASLARLDPLKITRIPERISKFVISSGSRDVITLLDCDFHYLYNDFGSVNSRASYSKKISSTNVPLNYPGRRLLVATDLDDRFHGIPGLVDVKRGDYLKISSPLFKVRALDDPYFAGTSSFYDSYNYDSSLNLARKYPYSRKNFVYLLPVEVVSIDD